MLKKILNKVLNEQEISNDEAISLINVDLEELKKAANQIRKHFCGNKFDLCSIINGIISFFKSWLLNNIKYPPNGFYYIPILYYFVLFIVISCLIS